MPASTTTTDKPKRAKKTQSAESLGIRDGTMKRLARRADVRRIAPSTLARLRDLAKRETKDTFYAVSTLIDADPAGRKTITLDDIRDALRERGQRTGYGHKA